MATAIALAVEILGSLALIFGFRTRCAALILALFTLTASFFFHAYWAVPAEQVMMTQLLFFKNMGIVGGLLTLAAWGQVAGALMPSVQNSLADTELNISAVWHRHKYYRITN